MKTKDWFLFVVEVLAWFGFIYYLLYSVKNDVNLIQSAVILLVLMYVAMIACPWVRNSCGWKGMWEKKDIENK